MDREPQMQDRVKSPDGEGPIVGRAELNGSWYVHVALNGSGKTWKGFARDVELIEAAGEGELRRTLAENEPRAERKRG